MILTMHGWDFEPKPLPPASEEGDEVEYDDRDDYLEVD